MTNYEYTVLPEYSPLYPKLPYEYKDYQKVSVYCRGDKETLQKFLPKEFKITSDVFEVFILKNNKIEGLDPYSEGGVVIPCAYKDKDRKSTRLNSSHVAISYAVFCLKKKK